jgi:transposase
MFVESQGVRLIYLPPYCPEFNPIEMCFSVIKDRFKQTKILENSGPDAHYIIRLTAIECITPYLLACLYDGCGYSLPDEMIQEY